MQNDENNAKKVKTDSNNIIPDELPISNDESKNSDNQIRLRIWRPTIPKYHINPVYYDDIIKTFVNRTSYKNYKVLDPVYASQIQFTQDINSLYLLKPQFEAKHLRQIDMQLLNEAKTILAENEKLMYKFYELRKLTKCEKREKSLVLLRAHIKNTKVYLNRIAELREFINFFIIEAEECWGYLTKLERITNKR